MNDSNYGILLEQIRRTCEEEKWEISSPDNLHYARESGKCPLYQYFVHGGPNHVWRNYPEVRNFLKRYGCILLPDGDAYMELQREFALSPRSRRIFLDAQKSLDAPNLNPTDDELLFYFVVTWGGKWFSEMFVFPERVAMLLEREDRIGYPKRGF